MHCVARLDPHRRHSSTLALVHWWSCAKIQPLEPSQPQHKTAAVHQLQLRSCVGAQHELGAALHVLCLHLNTALYVLCPQADPYDISPAEDILKDLSKWSANEMNWDKSLESKKWSDRKAALAQLRKLADYPRLASGR